MVDFNSALRWNVVGWLLASYILSYSLVYAVSTSPMTRCPRVCLIVGEAGKRPSGPVVALAVQLRTYTKRRLRNCKEGMVCEYNHVARL